MSNDTQVASKTQPRNIINDNGTLRRVDSRIIAGHFGIEHYNLMEYICKYSNEFNQLGMLTFKNEEKQGCRQPEKYALLNEDQTIFILTLSRNTAQAKKSLL